MELSHEAVKNPDEVLKAGEEKEFKIISIEPAEHRLGLSLKALLPAPEKAASTPLEPVAEPEDKAAPDTEAKAKEPETK